MRSVRALWSLLWIHGIGRVLKRKESQVLESLSLRVLSMTNDHGEREVSRLERVQRTTQETAVGLRKLGQALGHFSFLSVLCLALPMPRWYEQRLGGAANEDQIGQGWCRDREVLPG